MPCALGKEAWIEGHSGIRREWCKKWQDSDDNWRLDKKRRDHLEKERLDLWSPAAASLDVPFFLVSRQWTLSGHYSGHYSGHCKNTEN